MQPIFFKSKIHRKYKDELESLLFFNKYQKNYIQDISKSIESYGLPKIIVEGEYLKIELEKLKDVQSIFAFDGDDENASLLGILIYYRINIDEIIIIHIAVIDECSSYGEFSSEFIALRMINKLREDAKKIKGLKAIKLYYTGNLKNFTNIRILK